MLKLSFYLLLINDRIRIFHEPRWLQL